MRRWIKTTWMKLDTKWQVVFFLSPYVLLALFIIGIDRIDPAYRTSEFIQGTVIKKVFSTGKTGARVELIVETREGDSFWFNKSVNYPSGVGDKVKLRIYKRKFSGLESFKLES